VRIVEGMTTVLLVRHGRTTANASGVLAGWTPGVGLDELGRQQAADLGARLAALPLTALVTSPLQRCQETGALLLEGRAGASTTVPEGVATDDRLGECRYGDWTGQELKKLAKDPLWPIVQAHPSAVVFPGPEGESMRAMQQRGVDAVRDWDARIREQAGDDALWVAVSHGDVIKAILADALGMHLDAFQRLVVDPCSVSVIRYTKLRPFVVRINDVGGSVSALAPPKRRRRGGSSAADSDAAVGGGAGSQAAPSRRRGQRSTA
jgi:probable phosphomutase (TIGR03848 family)